MAVSLTLAQLWQNEQAPILDSIVFADGRLIVLDVCTIDNRKVIKPLVESTLSSFIEFNPDSFSSLISMCELDLESLGKVIVGEGSYGGDGFVACFKSNDDIAWLAFFESINPFHSIQFENGEIIVESTLATRIAFPITRPERLRVL